MFIVSVLASFAIYASQGYIREKHRCAKLSGLRQILPFVALGISPNSGFLDLKAHLEQREEALQSLGKV